MQKTFYLFFFFTLCSIVKATPTVIPDTKLKSTINQSTDSPLATITYSKNKIKKSPTVSLSQFLKQEQSVVRIMNNSPDSSQIIFSIRGFGDNAVANSLVLVDGFPLTNPSLLVPSFNSIPLTDIERVEIFQGSEGSLWGDQAVGGVVNIVTKHPKKFAIDSIWSIGSYTSTNDNIFISNHKDNGLYYKLFVALSHSDHYRHHNQQSAHNAAFMIGKDYAKGTINFNLQFYDNTINYPGGLTIDQFNQNPRAATDFKNYNRFRTYVLQVLSKHELNHTWLLETQINHRNTQGDGFVNTLFSRHDLLTSFNPRVIGSMDRLQLIAGYFTEMTNYQLSNSKKQSRNNALQNDIYTEATIAMTKQLDFILGARKAWQNNHIQFKQNESSDALNQVLVTEQGLKFHPTDNLTFFLRRDGNFSFPKANEETWVYNQTRLVTQTGTSYETGMSWQGIQSSSQMSIYRLELNHEIAFNPTQTTDQPFGAFTNLDQTLRQGISLADTYQLTSKLGVSSQFNYVKAVLSSGTYSGNDIPAVPAITANGGIDYSLTEHWVTQYRLLYTGSRYASDDLANIAKKIPGYFLHDIVLQYILKSYIFNFEIQNILNAKHADYAYYDVFTKQNVYYPGAGRSYLFSVKVDL